MRRLAGPRGSVRDESGAVLPTRLMVLSISAVALAGLAFVATDGPHTTPTVATAVVTTPTPTPTKPPTVPPPTIAPQHKKLHPKKPVNRSAVYVEIYNNSNIRGLAGSTAAKAQAAGWNVLGADNWYGTITTSTVYFPPRLHRAGKLLARDLGISRVTPAISPMQGDRLTVILTADYYG